MPDLPELNYVAIRAVVRLARPIPVVLGLMVLLLLLALGWHTGNPVWAIAAVLAAPLTAFLARLLVEIVAVVADTLLPR